MHGALASGACSHEESFISVFFARMVKNGVDNIELMDFIFFGSLAILGLEFLSFAVKTAGSE